MLYISRRASMMVYGVVDTDDDVETKIHREDINTIVSQHNLHIEGVVTGVTDNYVRELIPYQDMRYCRPVQVKTKALLGVDIRTYKDEISAILADDKLAKKYSSFRLSDFGAVVDWNVVSKCWLGLSLIWELDDNITVTGKFTRHCGLLEAGVIDIRNVSSEKIVEDVYTVMLVGEQTGFESPSRLKGYIIDHEDRARHWIKRLGCAWDDLHAIFE